MSVKGIVTYRSAGSSKIMLLDTFEVYNGVLRKKIKNLSFMQEML